LLPRGRAISPQTWARLIADVKQLAVPDDKLTNDGSQKRTRLRFGMRTLFVIVAVGAACAFTARNSDSYAAAGVALAFLGFFAATLIRRKRKQREARIALWLVAATLFWFAAVDRSVFYEYCRGCGIHHYMIEYRFLGVTLIASKHDEHHDLLARIARDLGKPCTHDYDRKHLVRLWGFLFPGRPCTGITCCLGGGEDTYDVRLRPRVLEKAKQQPEFAEEFHRRVLQDKDYDYLVEFLAELRRE
jgi:hypothetical protein